MTAEDDEGTRAHALRMASSMRIVATAMRMFPSTSLLLSWVSILEETSDFFEVRGGTVREFVATVRFARRHGSIARDLPSTRHLSGIADEQAIQIGDDDITIVQRVRK